MGARLRTVALRLLVAVVLWASVYLLVPLSPAAGQAVALVRLLGRYSQMRR